MEREYPTSVPFAISTPVYDGGQALVYVQFARHISWCVLLVRDNDTWVVKSKLVVGIS